MVLLTGSVGSEEKRPKSVGSGSWVLLLEENLVYLRSNTPE